MADEMDLKTFISSTLVQVVAGTHDAMQEIRKQGLPGLINPTVSSATYSDPKDVQFDVAVTVTDTKSGGGNAGIKIASIQIGGKGEMSTASQAVSRIQFTIPVSVPHTSENQYPQAGVYSSDDDY